MATLGTSGSQQRREPTLDIAAIGLTLPVSATAETIAAAYCAALAAAPRLPAYGLSTVSIAVWRSPEERRFLASQRAQLSARDALVPGRADAARTWLRPAAPTFVPRQTPTSHHLTHADAILPADAALAAPLLPPPVAPRVPPLTCACRPATHPPHQQPPTPTTRMHEAAPAVLNACVRVVRMSRAWAVSALVPLVCVTITPHGRPVSGPGRGAAQLRQAHALGKRGSVLPGTSPWPP